MNNKEIIILRNKIKTLKEDSLKNFDHYTSSENYNDSKANFENGILYAIRTIDFLIDTMIINNLKDGKK